ATILRRAMRRPREAATCPAATTGAASGFRGATAPAERPSLPNDKGAPLGAPFFHCRRMSGSDVPAPHRPRIHVNEVGFPAVHADPALLQRDGAQGERAEIAP